MRSCESDRLHRELEEQRKLIAKLHEMVQQMLQTMLLLQPTPSFVPDVNADAKTNTTNALHKMSSVVLLAGSPLERARAEATAAAQPSTLCAVSVTLGTSSLDPTEPPPPKEPEHFDLSDNDIKEVQLPNFDLAEDMFKVLQGKVDDADLVLLRDRYVKVTPPRR